MPRKRPVTRNQGAVPRHASTAYPMPPSRMMPPTSVYEAPATGPERATFSCRDLAERENEKFRGFLAISTRLAANGTPPGGTTRDRPCRRHPLTYRRPVYPPL